jgi:hypothetical protein
VISLGFVLFPTVCRSEDENPNAVKPYLVFEETKSPDGRHAVAWGLPKHPDVWAKVWQFDQEHPADTELSDENSKQAHEVFESVSNVAQDVENYIVDLGEGKIIRKLDCPRAPGVTAERELEPEYWGGGFYHPNRHFLEVVWARAGNLVLVNHTYRWDCVTFCAVLIRADKPALAVDLNKKLNEVVGNFVAKSFPRHFQYSKKDLNICFSEVRQLSDTRFSAHVEAVVEKYWSSDGAIIDFALTPSAAGVTLKVLDVRRLR